MGDPCIPNDAASAASDDGAPMSIPLCLDFPVLSFLACRVVQEAARSVTSGKWPHM